MGPSDILFTLARRLARRLGRSSRADVKSFNVTASDIDAAEQQRSDLHRAFYRDDGLTVTKWSHYLPVYDRHLSQYRARRDPIRLLEIGVFKGGSLRLWREYFGESAIIFGVDIDPRCARLDGLSGRVRIGSQNDAAFLKSVVAEMGGIDVVIDDGGHVAAQQIASFETLFPLLGADGLYVCEDLHTAYWRGVYGGGYRRRSTFVEYAKKIVDDIHADFHHRRQGIENANRTIDGIHFYNSMVVIQKGEQRAPRHVRLTGTKDLW